MTKGCWRATRKVSLGVPTERMLQHTCQNQMLAAFSSEWVDAYMIRRPTKFQRRQTARPTRHRRCSRRRHHNCSEWFLAARQASVLASLGSKRDTHHSAARRRRAIERACLARLIRVGRCAAAGVRVQRHLVVGHEVDALDDVDLAIMRPVVALGPDRRPYLESHGWSSRADVERAQVVRTEQP